MQLVLSLAILGISCSGFVWAEKIEEWPFTLMDKYVEEVKGQVLHLKEIARKFEFHEEDFHREHYDEAKALKDASVYDFVIVGGGTSGSVLANRLSEVPEWKILLLEAGEGEDIATQIPKNWELLRHTPHNWGFHTTPQNHSCLGMVDHKCSIPTGKILGGSSSINNLLFTRGHQRDYDLWADQGNDGWCYGDVLPFLKKIEDIHFEHFDRKMHHRGGYEHLEYPQHLTFLADQSIEAASKLEIPLVDYNGKHQSGIGIAQLTTKYGRRISTAEAYLAPAAKRDNLVIKQLSQAIKILVSPHTKEVQGVQYLHEKQLFVAKAEKETIIAAGALNTPKLLMLSGIGIKEDCTRLDLHPIVDLQVGHMLKTRAKFLGINLIYDKIKFEGVDAYHNLLMYLKYGKGPLTTPGIEAIAFAKTEKALKETTDYPDIELDFSQRVYEEPAYFRGVSPIQYDAIYKPLDGKKVINVAVILNHPKSTGFFTLRDNDPLHHPIIEPHLLSDPDYQDFETLLAGVKKVLKLVHSPPFEKLGVKISPHKVHGCEEIEFDSEAYWKCAIKYLTVPTSDVIGTAKMGPETDKKAVVDKKLRVYGVHKLRVADASVIPVPITGHLMAPTIMIGEKAAHLIKEDWL